MKIIAQQFLGGLGPLHPANRGAAAPRAPLLPTAMVEPKVREDIDGLPFTADGYDRAKTILKTEYGKVSEIVHAYHVRNIGALPMITGSHPPGKGASVL